MRFIKDSGKKVISCLRSFLIWSKVNVIIRVNNYKYKIPIKCAEFNFIKLKKHNARLCLFVKNRHELPHYNTLMEYVKEDSIILDIGSHLGEYLVGFVNNISEKGKVLAFEANPIAYSYLKKIIDLNKWNNKVKLINKAIGDKNKSNSIYIKSNSIDPSQTIYEKEGGIKQEIVMTKIDNILDEIKPNIILLDVEGYELKALEGAKNTLLNNSVIVSVEIHPKRLRELNTSVSEIYSYMTNLGYKELKGSKYEHPKPYKEDRPFNVIFEKSTLKQNN